MADGRDNQPNGTTETSQQLQTTTTTTTTAAICQENSRKDGSYLGVVGDLPYNLREETGLVSPLGLSKAVAAPEPTKDDDDDDEDEDDEEEDTGCAEEEEKVGGITRVLSGRNGKGGGGRRNNSTDNMSGRSLGSGEVPIMKEDSVPPMAAAAPAAASGGGPSKEDPSGGPAEGLDLSGIRGMKMKLTPEEKMRMVKRQEDGEDLNALAELVPGLYTAQEALSKRSLGNTGGATDGGGVGGGSNGIPDEALWKNPNGAAATSSDLPPLAGQEKQVGVSGGIAQGGAAQSNDEDVSTSMDDSSPKADIPDSRKVGGEEEESSVSVASASNHARLSQGEWQKGGGAGAAGNNKANVFDPATATTTKKKEDETDNDDNRSNSTDSSKRTFSAGSKKSSVDSIPNLENEAEQRPRAGEGNRKASSYKLQPLADPADDILQGGNKSKSMSGSKRNMKNSMRSIGTSRTDDEVPAPPPTASSSGIPQTMPMYLPTFKPATGCTNASDFIVRCFVARLRSGITVVKHGRSRWCKSRLRILHIHPDGRSLSWKPALGEPTSSKRPPKLDLSTCLEVRHAWSPDPLHPLFTGTPILRQKCEAANAHKSFALIFPKRTVDVTAVTADQCKVLMEGFSALCFRLQVANLAGRQKDGALDDSKRAGEKEGSDKGKSSEGRTSSVTSSPSNNEAPGLLRRSRFQ